MNKHYWIIFALNTEKVKSNNCQKQQQFFFNPFTYVHVILEIGDLVLHSLIIQIMSTEKVKSNNCQKQQQFFFNPFKKQSTYVY